MRGVEPPHNNSLSVAPLPVGVHALSVMTCFLVKTKAKVGERGLEPLKPKPTDFKSVVSTNSTTLP